VRLVLDTNVLLAAFVAQGTCHDLLEHCQREHHLVTSAFILQEFEDKLKGKFKVPTEKASVATSLLRGSAELVTRAGRVDCIVTGDKDLLSLGSFDGMPILLPGHFWRHEAEARLDRSDG
jgi:uncharacterized protein